jgi:hypothetical protein
MIAPPIAPIAVMEIMRAGIVRRVSGRRNDSGKKKIMNKMTIEANTAPRS